MERGIAGMAVQFDQTAAEDRADTGQQYRLESIIVLVLAIIFHPWACMSSVLRLSTIKLENQLTIGIVGAGGFAAFAAKAFMQVKGIRIAGVTDVDTSNALELANATGARAHPTYEQMLDDSALDLIYIATPPYLHYQQSRQALEAGKHVICEKPAALKTHEAEELADYARSRSLLYVVNLMQRYNPMYDVVKRIIAEQWLSEFVHGFFENYASDEKMGPDHWFWDEKKSGGIFIEHGVHFFDMFEGWFGKGELVHAVEMVRECEGKNVIDRVQATAMYQNSPVTFYHGFNQPRLLDRQELRLQFAHGDITLYEWIPVKIRLHGLLSHNHLEKIKQLIPGARVEIYSLPKDSPKTVRGKFRDISFDMLATITQGNISDKMPRYEQLLIEMITDQWTWIKDSNHTRVIDDRNAVESLRIAELAVNQSISF